MSYKYLHVERRDAVEHVALNRPDLRNAFNDDVVTELAAWCGTARRAFPELRVVVLSGRGKVFSAGADLGWMSRTAEYSRDDFRADASRLGEMLRALDALPQAVVGRVHGAAIAGGAGLVAVCDIVVASEETSFAFSETRLGIVPAVISPFVIGKIGASAARELFLSARRFPAVRARELGLVHAVCPADALDATVDEYVEDLLLGAPGAIAAAKRLVREVALQEPDAVAHLTSEMVADRRLSDEGRAGIHAFLEKRPPPWAADA